MQTLEEKLYESTLTLQQSKIVSKEMKNILPKQEEKYYFFTK